MTTQFLPTRLLEKSTWPPLPTSGRHMLASYDNSSVVVYQTFCSEIADFAVENGYIGGPVIKSEKMTWLKISFLWTMNQSQWATLPGKERVLAIKIDKDHFLEVLETATTGKAYTTPVYRIGTEAVCLQWTPDYDANGKVLERHTLLIGLQKYMLQKFNSKFIEAMEDITDFVREQHTWILNGDHSSLIVPAEKPFVPDNEGVCWLMMLDKFEEAKPRLRNYDRNEIALFLQGSFNPVHTKHVQMMTYCKAWIESTTKYRVVAGVVAVNSDRLVLHKLIRTCKSKILLIKSHHRERLFKIAVQSNPWIVTYEMNRFSLQQMKHDTHRRLGGELEWFHIFGADRGVEICKTPVRNAIFIGREGITTQLMKQFHKAVADGIIKPRDVYIMPMEMTNVNSTHIRRKLVKVMGLKSRDKKLDIIERLVKKGWLNKDVGDYLVDREYDLYYKLEPLSNP